MKCTIKLPRSTHDRLLGACFFLGMGLGIIARHFWAGLFIGWGCGLLGSAILHSVGVPTEDDV